MDARLTRLIARRGQSAKKREELLAKRKAIVDLQEEEGREDLSTEEEAEFRALTGKIAEFDGDIAKDDERIAELSAEEERSTSITEGAAAVRRAQARASVVSNELIYRKDGQHSYFRDLVRSNPMFGLAGQVEARERLARHESEVRSAPEYRDLSTTDTAGGGFVPPRYLVDQYVDVARAARPVADIVTNLALPSGTDSINIPVITTGTSVAAQDGNNAAVSETDIVEATVTAGVKTVAGQQDVAIQLLDQSPIAFDQVIFRDLTAECERLVDQYVIRGTNANGQPLGITGVSSPVAVTYTDTTPTVAELYSALANTIQQIHTARYASPTHIVMHPRRWGWIVAASDTTGRPLVVPSGASVNAVGTHQVGAQGIVGNMFGLPVVLDANIATNIGAGTNQDTVLVLKADDLLLWESGLRSRVLPDVGSGTLTVRLQVYKYMAFQGARAPKSIGKVDGTGLTPPAF